MCFCISGYLGSFWCVIHMFDVLVYLPICQFILLSSYLSMYPFISLIIYLSVRLFVYLSLYVCMYVYTHLNYITNDLLFYTRRWKGFVSNTPACFLPCWCVCAMYVYTHVCICTHIHTHIHAHIYGLIMIGNRNCLPLFITLLSISSLF